MLSFKCTAVKQKLLYNKIKKKYSNEETQTFLQNHKKKY